MKLRPVTKLDKRKKVTSRKIDDDVMLENYDVNVFFGLMANLEQFGNQIPDA